MAFLLEHGLGILALVSGLLCVWLLVKENIYTFPIGLLYAVITVVVMLKNRLYADVLLNGYYVLMNAYGWYFWLRGGGARRNEQALTVGRLPTDQWPILALVTCIGTGLMGWYFATCTDADFAYVDSFTTVASFIAMWMSAKKYIDSWWLWFVVNVVCVVLYLFKAEQDPNLYYYAALYAVYLPMAVMGYRAWAPRVNIEQKLA